MKQIVGRRKMMAWIHDPGFWFQIISLIMAAELNHSFIDKLVPFIPLNPWRKIFFRCNFQTGMRFTRDSTLEHLWPKYNSNVRIPRSNISISFSPLFSLFPFTLHDPLQILAWMNSKIWTKKKWNKVRND